MSDCIFVNGKAVPMGEATAQAAAGGGTVADLLRQMNLLGRKIAVEKNGVIIPKSRHAAEPLVAGDRVEVVTAVGGG